MPQHIVQQGNEISGWPVPLSETDRESYERSKSKPDYGVDPIMMGLLSAGASLMRNSGWRNTPITSEEQWGHAIPAGMNAYLQQRRANMDEEQVAYSRQLQENQARQAQIEKAQKDQALREQAELEQRQLNEFKNRVKNDPDFKTGPQQRSKGNILAMADRDFKKAIDMYEAKKLGALKAGRRLTPEEVQEFEAQGYKGAYQIKTDSEGIQTVFDVAGSVVKKAEADKPGEHSMSGRALMMQFPERYGGILQDTGMYKVGPGMLEGSIDVLSEIAIAGAEEEEDEAFQIKWNDTIGKYSVSDKSGRITWHDKPSPEMSQDSYDSLYKRATEIALEEENDTLQHQLELINIGPEHITKKTERILKEIDELNQNQKEQAPDFKDAEFGKKGGAFPESIIKYMDDHKLIIGGDTVRIAVKNGMVTQYKDDGTPKQTLWSRDEIIKKYPKLKLMMQDPDAVYTLDAQGLPVVAKVDDLDHYVIKGRWNNEKRYYEDIHVPVINGKFDWDNERSLGANKFKDDATYYVKSEKQTDGQWRNVEYQRGNPTYKKLLGVSKEKYKMDTVERTYNAEVDRKKLMKGDFDSLLKRLKKVYGVEADDIERLQLTADQDIDKAWTQAIAYVNNDKPYTYYGNLATGAELKEEWEKYNLTENAAGMELRDTALYRLTKDGEWTDVNDERNKTLFSQESSLRKEYNYVISDVQTAATAYNSLLAGASARNGAGDIMIITSYRRMFEPDSVVREGEFAITQEAQGVWNRLTNMPKQFMEGDRLKDSARQQFIALARDYMAGLSGYFQNQKNRYRSIAERYGFKDVNTVINDPLQGLPLTAGQVMKFESTWVMNPDGERDANGHIIMMERVSGKRVTISEIQDVLENTSTGDDDNTRTTVKNVPDNNRTKIVDPAILGNTYFSGLSTPSGTVGATSLGRGAPE